MKTKAYANFNELVFEDRNKYYGAYALRKNYEDNLLIGLFFGMMFLGAIVAIPYASSLFKDKQVDLGGITIPDDPYVNIIDLTPKTEDLIEKPKSAPEQQKPQQSIKYSIPIVSEKSEDVATPEELKDVNPGKDNSDGEKGLLTIKEPGKGDGEGGEGKDEGGDKNKGPQDLFSLEVRPQYPGGDKAMYEFLGKNMRYPDRAKDIGIEGKVYISFIIDEFGNIGQVSVLRGIGGGCDEEAARVIKKMPRWSPGKQGGHYVKVRYQIPIEFVLN